MAAIPHPQDAEAQWNGLTLGEHVFPGVWVIEGISERDLQIKPRKGADLGRVRDRGYKNAPLTLNGTIVGPEQWADIQPIIRAIHPRKKGKDRNAFQISSPYAAYLGVNHIYIHKIHTPRVMPNQIIQLRIEVVEWSDTPKKLKKRVGKPEPVEQRNANAIAGGLGRTFTDPISGQERLDTGIDMPSANAFAALTN